MMETDKARLIAEIRRLQQQIAHVTGQFTPGIWIELDLTIVQLKSLFFIDYEGGTNFRKLVAAFGVTPSDLTGVVDRLVKRGLVSRKENPEDRRTRLLQVTNKGKALLDKLMESGLGRMSSILNQLSTEELTALEEGLAAIARISMLQQGEIKDEHD